MRECICDFLVYVLCGVLLAPTVWASDTAPSTKNGQVNTEEFHISPAYLPDHQIGESGPLVMDTTERKNDAGILMLMR